MTENNSYYAYAQRNIQATPKKGMCFFTLYYSVMEIEYLCPDVQSK